MSTDAEIWSSIADEYDIASASLTPRLARAAFKSIVRAIPSKGATILDVATGTGALPLVAAEHFSESSDTKIIATDYAKGMVEFLQRAKTAKGWHHVSCEVMDAQDLKLPDNSVQAAFCIAGVFLMDDGIKAVKEMRRVLAPGGQICFTTWKYVAGMVLTLEAYKILKLPPPQMPHGPQWREKAWLEGFMTDLGFRETRVEEMELYIEVPDEELVAFGRTLRHLPVFKLVGSGLTEAQKSEWPELIAEAARNLQGKKDIYKFRNDAYIVSGTK